MNDIISRCLSCPVKSQLNLLMTLTTSAFYFVNVLTRSQDSRYSLVSPILVGCRCAILMDEKVCARLTELGCHHRNIVPCKIFTVKRLLQEYRPVPGMHVKHPFHVCVPINCVPGNDTILWESILLSKERFCCGAAYWMKNNASYKVTSRSLLNTGCCLENTGTCDSSKKQNWLHPASLKAARSLCTFVLGSAGACNIALSDAIIQRDHSIC